MFLFCEKNTSIRCLYFWIKSSEQQ